MEHTVTVRRWYDFQSWKEKVMMTWTATPEGKLEVHWNTLLQQIPPDRMRWNEEHLCWELLLNF